MPIRLEERLRAARARVFVGRDDELALLASALDADALPFLVLYVFGPGGVGKTSLLHAYDRLCRQREVAARYVDASSIEPSPEAFLTALRDALALEAGTDPLEALAAHGHRQVLLLDTVETISVLDGWLRTHFLPRLPDHVLVVLAGRDLPAQGWQADPGWQALVRTVSLRNLDGAASRALLRQRAIADEQHEAVLAFTHGHPLATSLVADLLKQQPGMVFEPQQAPDVIKMLLEQFVQKVPGPAHRGALEACSLVRYVTESLLQSLLDASPIHEVFVWLRSLSCVEAGPRGLFLHALAREVLAADLRWRNPEWHAELHRRARHFYTTSLKQDEGRFDQEILADYTFLYRDHPLVRPLFARLRSQWAGSDPILEDTARASDWPALAEMVAHHEGDAAQRLARHWFDRQPQGVLVYRDQAGAPLGFMLTLRLNETTPEDRAADPATQQAWAYLQMHGALRPGECATMFRFWMARATYQDVSPVQSLIFLSRIRHYLNTPGLAFTFLPCRKPAYWGLIFAYAAMTRLAEADYEVEGQPYAVFGHDWRAMPPTAWLDLLAQRSFSTMPSAQPPPAEERLLVLSRSGFAEAVRDALRAYTQPGKLRRNPLLRSRLVIDRAGLNADEPRRLEALRHLLVTTAATLEANPREASYFRAVQYTYLQPAPTQEQAAEHLGLPFSTFRRHLKRGLNRITDLLWQQEIGSTP